MKSTEKIATYIIEGKLTLEEGKKILDNMKPADKTAVYKALKRLLAQQTIYVSAGNNLLEPEKRLIEKMFSGKKMVFERNEKMGSGIIVKENDTIYDASLPGIIKSMFGSLRENL